MSRVFKFAEEACWDRSDRFRQVRKSVRFRIVSVGKIGDVRLNECFDADFGIFYDPEDEWLIGILSDLQPTIAWSQFVFWKKTDHSGVDVIDPADDRVVAKIVVNRGPVGPDPSGETLEIDMTNVVDLNSWRVERE